MAETLFGFCYYCYCWLYFHLKMGETVLVEAVQLL